ncbi:c-type cytochrome [Ralstonia flaminis]|jgi:cytochrome c553|uniref:Cytochrome c-552 n=1 Tax=Ralstonia flaminis TaxID=3058597 RepID=A0ABN9JS88_9RALS|nr:c-type cytochrome [Ralstonia sp. LMG 18101]CAJ0822672.1 Cytochrome c-552 [Ralstonia sp. LMG 18101]
MKRSHQPGRIWLGGLAALVAIGWSGAAGAQDGEKLAAQLCSSCHGVHGKSESPMFPRLDAQVPNYLEAQLKGFRNHARGETDAQSFMWGIASQLDDKTITSLADYYAHQTAPAGASGDPALLARGKEIFEHGLPSEGVPACASCHGQHAEGQDTFPRLAGQHEAYLERQITHFRSGARGNAPVMSAVAHTLNDEQAKAVATFLQAQ